MRLLSHELEANQQMTEEVSKHRDLFVMSLPEVYYPRPIIEARPEIRVNLAPRLDIYEFASIDDYYRQLQVLLDIKEDRRVPLVERGKPVNTLMSALEQRTEEFWRIVDKYADPPQRVRFLTRIGRR